MLDWVMWEMQPPAGSVCLVPCHDSLSPTVALVCPRYEVPAAADTTYSWVHNFPRCPSIAGPVLSTPISGLSSWHTYYARPCLLNEEVPCPMWVACRLAHRTLLWSLAAAVLEWSLLYKGQQGMLHSQTFLILKPRRDSQNQNYIKKPRTEVPALLS